MSDVNVNFPPSASPFRAVAAGEVEAMVNGLRAEVEGQMSLADEKLAENSRKLEDNAISPDDFAGESDFDKVQAAIVNAIANKKSIRLSRMYDVTNTNSLLINKVDDRWGLIFYGVGGGFKKTNAGFMFSTNSPYIGDIHFNQVKFNSVGGAGTKIFDATKMIRVFSLGCIYRSVDMIVQTSNGYIQSYRFTADSIVGGAGSAIECPGAFDVIFSNVLVEHRENFFTQLKGTTSTYPSLYNVTFRDVCVEGLTGYGYKFALTTQITIDGGYYEANSVGDIIFDPAGIFVGVSISNIRSQITTNVDLRPVIKWGGQVQTAKVFNVVGVGLPINDTSAMTLGYITTENERKQAGGGSASLVNVDPDKRLIRQSSLPNYTDTGGISTSDLGLFKRLKTSRTQTLTASANNQIIVTFPEAIRNDDLISIQMIRPQLLSQDVILASYNKNGSTVEIWVKNNHTATVDITLHITVLKPFYSVTG